jgi:hypothetical protein
VADASTIRRRLARDLPSKAVRSRGHQLRPRVRLENLKDREWMIESVEEFFGLLEAESSEANHRLRYEEALPGVWMSILDAHPDDQDLPALVAFNKTIPVEVMWRIARDGDERARYAIAEKRRSGSDLLAFLAQVGDDAVRCRVARHRNATAEILTKLAADAWSEVRTTARERLASM